MPVTASRAVLRQSQFLTRRTAIRHASTGPEASKAKEAASSAVSKASEGLSRVTASAGPILSNATQALRKVGGRTGKVISFVDCKDTLWGTGYHTGLYPFLFQWMWWEDDNATRDPGYPLVHWQTSTAHLFNSFIWICVTDKLAT